MLSPLGPPLPEDSAKATATCWRLGAMLIDLDAGHVIREGREHRLDRSGSALLSLLLTHRGETLDKDRLLRAGWPGRVVSENSLAKAISKLRQALGDEQGELLRVVHGYGYRWAAVVEAQPVSAPVDVYAGGQDSTVQARERRSTVLRLALWTGLIAAAPVIYLLASAASWHQASSAVPARTVAVVNPANAEDVIAVLPLHDRSQDGESALLAFGIANRLRDDMQRVPALRIVDRGRSEAVAAPEFDPAALQAALGANLLVGGEIEGNAGGLSIRLQLYDTRGRIPAQLRQFNYQGGDQTELMQELSGWLMEQVGGQPQRWGFDPDGRRGTPSAEAYRTFLRASTLFAGNNDPNSQRRTLSVLKQALALDPDYADALRMYAGILGGSGYYADSIEELVEGRRQALQSMDRMLALVPDHAAALLERSEMRLLYRFDAEGARKDLDAAKSLAAGNPALLARALVWEARLLASTAPMSEAIATGERAAALDPQSGALRNLGWHYLAAGDTGNARRVLRMQLVDLPENPHVNFYLGLCDIFEGRPADALPRLEHSSTLFRLVGTAIAEHELGDRLASDLALRKLKDQFAIADGYWAGAVHAWRGEPEEALAWLERALEGGDSSVMYLPFDPLLEPLRGDPRLPALLQRLREPIKAGPSGP